MSRNDPRRERGAVSVEFALALPALLMLVLGGVHLGRALATRHRLSEATGYATRAAAIRGVTNPVVLRNEILGRMDTGGANCSALVVSTRVVPGLAGTRRLEVQARCFLAPALGQALLGAIGPNDVSVTASMPM